MKPGTYRTIAAVCAIIVAALAVAGIGGGIIYRMARLESRVDEVYAKVESIEGLLNGTADTGDVERGGGTEGIAASVR